MERPLEMHDGRELSEERHFCLQRVRCCCCTPPRWARVPICLVIFYVVLMPFIYLLGHFLVYPGDDYAPEKLDFLGYSCRLFNFTGRYGDVVAEKCSMDSALGSPVPVLAFGGNGMNMFDTAESVIDFFPKNPQADVAWEVYSLSFPGFQYAPRSGWTTEGRTEADAMDLLHHLSSVKDQKVVVFGWSLGTSVAAALASRQADQVQCVLLGNPFTSIRDVALAWTYGIAGLYLYLLDEWPTKRFAQNFKSPTIVMSSMEDEVVPLWMHREVFQQVPVQKKKLAELHAGHMDIGFFRADTEEAIHQWCVPSALARMV